MPGIGLSKCVFITGGTSGIGHALGHKIKDLPNKPQVIMAGRRQERLDELTKDGFETIRMDLGSDRASLQKEAEQLLAKYPDASRYPSRFRTCGLMISQGRQTFLIAVTSGLAIFPGAKVPNYSASKAAVHSLTLSLRAQLAGTGVNVLEIIPPLVESELHDAEGTTEALSKIWMPLDDFIRITMDGLLFGNPHIGAGMSEDAWNKFEKGKDEIVSQLWKRIEAQKQ